MHDVLLAGRRGVITGGTRGIGAATVAMLARNGAALASISRDGSTPQGGVALGVAGDVASFESLAAAFARCEAELGAVDFVVACAGASHQGPIQPAAPAAWRGVLATNLLGVAYTARLALECFARAGRRGDLVVIGSVAGLRAYAGEPAYVASKWGVVGLVRAIRLLETSHPVRTSLICPGLVDTPLTHSTPQLEAWLSAVDPLLPEDIAQAVAFVIGQPDHVVIDEVVVRPQMQET